MSPAVLLVAAALAADALDGGLAPPADAGVLDERVKVTPIAAPAYTPELGFIGSVGAIVSWSGSPGSRQTPRSSLTAVASYTTIGAVLTQEQLASYWLGDRLRVSALVDVRDVPDHYFGVGVVPALRAVQSAEQTAYRRLSWSANPRALVKAWGPLYVGAMVDVRGTLSRDLSPGVAADPYFQAHGERRALSSGLGLSVVWDSRDVPVNAYRGWYLSADWVAYLPTPIGTSRWMSAGFDYRHYVTLGREGSTLCWQLQYRTAWGDVPWSDLPSTGTPYDLRAYRAGRFRDTTAATVLLEYRWMMPFEPEPWWKLWTRLGLVAWVGVGALGATALPDFAAVLPAAGLGVRVLIQDRLTLRLDYGLGRGGSSAFYFQFLEAF